MLTARDIFFFVVFLLLTYTSCSQSKNDRTILGKSHATEELKSVLAGKTQHNVIANKTVLIKDSMTAISIAESVLFSIYGKDNILNQRPYETYLIDNYWIIGGTLPKDFLGGTFLIILNAKDSKILRITHGK